MCEPDHINSVQCRYERLRYGRYYFESGEYVRHAEAVPGDRLDPVVEIEENLGTVELPCGKVDCRASCLEYVVHAPRGGKKLTLSECGLSPLVSVL